MPCPPPGVFPTQESNPGLLDWQVDSLPLSYLGSPYLHKSHSEESYCEPFTQVPSYEHFIQPHFSVLLICPCHSLNTSLLFSTQWHPTPVLLPGKSHGRRSLVGCSPWGHEESDTTERLHFHFSLSHTGEGNGNPLQCSRLENPMDAGAWWAAVYGVAQSRTRLK